MGAVERAVFVQRIHRAIGHGESVMRIVMRKQALATKGQQIVEATRPGVELLKMSRVIAVINRISCLLYTSDAADD